MNFNKSIKKIQKKDLSIAILLVIGIAAVLNFFSYQLFYRWDLTDTKIYSISKVSRDTVGALDDVVNITAYFSENLPNQLLSLRQEVGDILTEYEAYSGGKIKVNFVDPGTDEKMQQELNMKGIPQLTFEVYEKDKRQLVKGYLGMTISYGDKSEVIPMLKQDTSDLEYQLTSSIKKVTSENISMIGFLNSNQTLTSDSLKAANEKLKEIYNVVDVQIKDGKIEPEVNTLIIVGPKEKFSESQSAALDSFVKSGHSLLVLVEGVTVGEGLMTNKNATGIEKLLEKYGVRVNTDLVLDKRSGMASFSQGFISFSTPYPFWPKVTTEGFNKENSAVSNLESVIFPWASSIDIISNNENVSKLAFTTDQAYVVKDNINISPNNIPASQDTKGVYNLAVSVKDINKSEGNAGGRLIVVGDSDFINDNFLQNNPDNLTFFQNLVDSLSLDDALINIRSKVVASRPIKEDLSDSSKAMIRYVNVFGVTILVVGFGLFRYYSRRRSRFIDEL